MNSSSPILGIHAYGLFDVFTFNLLGIPISIPAYIARSISVAARATLDDKSVLKSPLMSDILYNMEPLMKYWTKAIC